MASRTVSPQEAHALMTEQGYVYVDVRSPGEFEQGRPTGSYNVPLAMPGPGGMAPNPNFLATMKALFPADAKLVIGCAMGGRSARACAVLEQAGYSQLVDQRAGFDGRRDAFGGMSEPGWGRAGLPSSQGPDPERGHAALSSRKS